jgi:four helix bundle protein
MAFDVHDRSLSLLRSLVPVLARLAAADPELENQIRRAARNVALNIAEANRRKGRDRANRFRWALAEAAEVSSGLPDRDGARLLVADDLAEPLELADRVRAMAYRLSR